MDRSTDALAQWLLREGLKTGDRVAIHWSNSVEVVNLYFACFKAGLIAVPVNNRLKAPEIAYILGHSKAKVCFSRRRHCARDSAGTLPRPLEWRLQPPASVWSRYHN